MSIGTLSDYLAAVEHLYRTWVPSALKNAIDLWFRGVNDYRWPLLPGAYRPGRVEKYNEYGAVVEFKTLAVAFLEQEPHDEWAWYFLMQHHGLPTRLLDWSENALVALFFALNGFDPAKHQLPCVWAIDPREVNRAAYHKYELVAPGGNVTSHWLPSTLRDKNKPACFEADGESYTNELPLALIPQRREARLLAQRGAFTIHGVLTSSLDSLIEKPPPRSDGPRVCKLLVDPARAQTMLHQLSVLGLRASTLFPEPQTLARELAEKFTS